MDTITIHRIAVIAFIIWSFPLGFFRSRFRKMVYQTDSWMINIKPVFWKEIKVLFGFHHLTERAELRVIDFYRFYLIVYFAILVLILSK
jgi:peroxiredoxin Q/BCP